MKSFYYLVGPFFFLLASVIAQTIEIGAPVDGDVLHDYEQFIAQIIKPTSIMGCIDIGIALALAACDQGECPDPSNKLGSVLYAGSFEPASQGQDGKYQNFTLTVPSNMERGTTIFTLTHLCLLGAGPVPLLEFRNVTLTIE